MVSRRRCCRASSLLSFPLQAQTVDYGALGAAVRRTGHHIGHRQAAARQDAPANIEIITQDDIRRSGATSIPDVLQFVPGVDVRQPARPRGGRGSAATTRLQPASDGPGEGRQVYMVDYGRIIWPRSRSNFRNPSDRSDKGPDSALYGFNAVSGVINIITYDPLKEPGSMLQRRGSARRPLLQGSAVDHGASWRRTPAFACRSAACEQQRRISLQVRWDRDPKCAIRTHRQRSTSTAEAQVWRRVWRSTLKASVTATAEQNDHRPALVPTFRHLHTNSVKAGVMADTGMGHARPSTPIATGCVSLQSDGASLTTRSADDTVYVLQASDHAEAAAPTTRSVSAWNTQQCPTPRHGGRHHLVHGLFGRRHVGLADYTGRCPSPTRCASTTLTLSYIRHTGCRVRLYQLRLQRRRPSRSPASIPAWSTN